jgi:eukaryotic-like serine/threonine-protein kinase
MQAGEQVGKYILEHKLGEGGMAMVWMARHMDLGKAVAIKCLSTRLTTNPEYEQRFLSEGRRQAGLRHPNIVEVVDFLVKGDDRFLVMDFVEGLSVSAYQKQAGGGPLPLEMVDSVGWEIGQALEYAHKKGLIHRDVKPSNILLDAENKAYLTDFGIALAVGEDRLTRTGMAVGTVHYMSPEQIARPREIDHRSDIYSFGCVLYDMLTGRPPFVSAEGDTDFTVMNGHLTLPAAPVHTLNPQVPPAVEQVVQKCLAKDPNDRYATAADMARALRRAFHPDMTTGQLRTPELMQTGTVTAQVPAAPVPAGQNKLVLAAVAFLVVLGLGGAAVWFLGGGSEEPPVVKQEAPVVQQEAAPSPPPVVVETTPVTPPVVVPEAPKAPKKQVEKKKPAQEDAAQFERRMKACQALGLSEAQCAERLKGTP